MKPLRKGAARTALGENIESITGPQQIDPRDGLAGINLSDPQTFQLSPDQIGAVIGGAIEQSLAEMYPGSAGAQAATNQMFWRYMNHNLWNLIRSLRASNQLEKV